MNELDNHFAHMRSYQIDFRDTAHCFSVMVQNRIERIRKKEIREDLSRWMNFPQAMLWECGAELLGDLAEQNGDVTVGDCIDYNIFDVPIDGLSLVKPEHLIHFVKANCAYLFVGGYMQTHPNPCEKFREPLIAYLYRELGAES